MPTTALSPAPRTASERSAARRRILVTGGNAARIRAVAQSLRSLRAEIVTADWHDYPERLDQRVMAMAVSEPLPASMAGAIAAVRGQPAGEHIALYALVAPGANSRKVRSIYLAGATAVIEWPREKNILAGILAETMGMSVVRGPSSRPDVALARTIRAHLRLGPRPGSAIRLSTREGVVAASGETRSLAELRELVETIARVPGVKQVLTTGLRVAPSEVEDRAIKRNIRTVVRAMSEIDETALRIAVRAGRVRLQGVATSRDEFHRLLDSIAAIKGVRDLDWNITLADREEESDGKVGRRLHRAVTTLHPREKVEISVLGGVAVLAGRVRSLATKRAIERLAERDDGVARVVNKLVVAR